MPLTGCVTLETDFVLAAETVTADEGSVVDLVCVVAVAVGTVTADLVCVVAVAVGTVAAEVNSWTEGLVIGLLFGSHPNVVDL